MMLPRLSPSSPFSLFRPLEGTSSSLSHLPPNGSPKLVTSTRYWYGKTVIYCHQAEKPFFRLYRRSYGGEYSIRQDQRAFTAIPQRPMRFCAVHCVDVLGRTLQMSYKSVSGDSNKLTYTETSLRWL